MWVTHFWHDLDLKSSPEMSSYQDFALEDICYKLKWWNDKEWHHVMHPSALPWQLKAAGQAGVTAKAGTGHQGREALQFPAQAEEGTNTCQRGFGTLVSPWFGEETASPLEVPSSPHFLQLNLKPCNLAWTVRANGVLSSVPVGAELQFKTAPISQPPALLLPPEPAWGLAHWDAFPEIFSLKKPAVFSMLFSFLSGKHFSWNWIFSEIESIKRFLKHLISKAVGREKLPYTKGLPNPASLLMPKPDTWGKQGSMKYLWLFNCFFVSQITVSLSTRLSIVLMFNTGVGNILLLFYNTSDIYTHSGFLEVFCKRKLSFPCC